MKHAIRLSCLSVALSACATISGNYEITAVDTQGNSLNAGMIMTATGSGIYTVRNALCNTYPQAKIVIIDTKTRQELAGESRYQCN